MVQNHIYVYIYYTLSSTMEVYNITYIVEYKISNNLDLSGTCYQNITGQITSKNNYFIAQNNSNYVGKRNSLITKMFSNRKEEIFLIVNNKVYTYVNTSQVV